MYILCVDLENKKIKRIGTSFGIIKIEIRKLISRLEIWKSPNKTRNKSAVRREMKFNWKETWNVFYKTRDE